MKIKYFILFFLVALKSYACSCGFGTINGKFMYADFVAKVKITKSLKDWSFENAIKPYTVNFTIERLYKGQEITSISLDNYSDASCGLVLAESSEWIIFAYKNDKDKYSTNLCSGSKQIDRVFNESLYPNATKNYNSVIDKTLEVLELFKKYEVNVSNKILLINSKDNFNEHFNKYNACDFLNEYGIYKIILNADLSIKDVIAIKGYSNQFDKEFKKNIIEKAKFIKQAKENRETVPQDTEWLLLITGAKYDDQPCFFNQYNYL